MWLRLGCSFLLGLAGTLTIIPLILRSCWRVRERPTDCHHTHLAPVPRWGGLALVCAFVLIETFVAAVAPDHRARTPDRNLVMVSSLFMFAVGFWDDLRPLGAKRKLLLQILIAGLVCSYGLEIRICTVPFGAGSLQLGAWGVPITILWLVGMTNLINLIDGMDGLAGGICLMLMVLVAVVGHHMGSFELLACGMAGALVGFLRFNLPPARIYLGDGGAYFLGFQLGLFSLINSQKGAIYAALVAPLFVLALPITDAVLTVLRRALRGLPIFRPDRKHLHHRLIATGLTRGNALCWVYGLELALLALGLAAFWSSAQGMIVLASIAILILLGCAGVLPFSRRWFAVGQALSQSLAMRPQTRYALCLAQWLELEGARHEALDSLWLDLVFAARRLGFISARLSFNGTERLWQNPTAHAPLRSSRYKVRCGPNGLFEFEVPGCPNRDSRCPCPNSQCDSSTKACVSDPRVFELMSELLAESWTRAVAQWSRRHPPPFGLPPAHTLRTGAGRVSRQAARSAASLFRFTARKSQPGV